MKETKDRWLRKVHPPFQPVVILPPVFAFGGDKAFDAQPLQKLDAASARGIQWAWSGSSKQVR